MNTRRRNERGPSSQQAQVFQKGEWPTATEVAQLAQDVPVVLRGFGNNMSLVQKLETDAYLATLNINEKLTVKKGVHESGDPNALPAFDHASTTGLSLSDFLAVYRKPSTMVPYLAAYGENYDVAKVDTDRASYLPKKRDPFRGELRSILPRVAKDSSPAAVNDDERLDPRGHFSAVCSALKEEGYQCSNVALWFSGRPVTTPLHYGKKLPSFSFTYLWGDCVIALILFIDSLRCQATSTIYICVIHSYIDDYATVSILGGSGEKEWFLAPPEASPLVRGPLRFRTGYLANTSGFKPWLQPTASSSSSSSSCRGLSSNRSNSSISSSGSSNISSSSSGSWEQQEEWPASLHNNSDGRGATHSEGPLADADAARDAAAHACFRSVTVGLGDLLLVPPKWWHAVVTRGRCLAANWWFTPPDKHALEVARLAAAEAASREDGSWPCQKCSTMNDAPVYGDSSGSVGGGGGLVPGQSPACVLCSHVKGARTAAYCSRRLEHVLYRFLCFFSRRACV
jgi:hypothetical protein